jgi:IS30 family transposase
MNCKHLSQIERYQIHSLMKAQHNITQIARLLGRDKSTISRKLRRNSGCRGYRAKQACELASKRSESSRNASKLLKNLRGQKQKQKQKRKRYASGRDRMGQIPNRRPLSERPSHIDKRLQMGHWECDIVIGANHKQAIVTVVGRKSGYAVMAKVSNKTSDSVAR